MELNTGIRQGCPLAPLLFMLAVEVLALAITQDPGLTGVMVPGSSSERHVFSAFVDDSTVFLQEVRQLPRVLDLVATFGKLSGLTVQPSKSQVIFLNTAVSVTSYEGIPVLRSGATTRYLGHQVGTGDLADANWAVRIRTVQRRLATATRLATSVTFRAQILNVILLPGILFTAAVFDTPAWADLELRNHQNPNSLESVVINGNKSAQSQSGTTIHAASSGRHWINLDSSGGESATH
uniref:Reverse transcriptase domain-containing protein n=1 Tax=Peronospora matthiolae TaxID=2874970 RepID=A0AAV1V5T8_9STRA